MRALPKTVGVGFKPQHFADVMHELATADEISVAPVGFVEVHAENYMAQGGAMRAQLAVLKQHLPISLHGVALSLGGADIPDAAHLARLKDLLAWVEPAQFSEHLAWSGHSGIFVNDLLPLAYDQATLARVAMHIDMVQQALGRRILIENPSSYLQLGDNSAAAETDFLASLVEKSGCGLLLDVNNVYVSCCNLGWNSADYLLGLPLDAVGEVHLAGHAEEREADGGAVLIDNHGAPVADAVWALYATLVEKIGAVPTLIEWDTHVPDWDVLRGECVKATAILQRRGEAHKDNPSGTVAAE